MLTIEQLTSGYGQLNVLHEVSLRVEAGELVSLLGANGAGKSTLLRAISGLLPYRGAVLLAGEDISRVPAENLVGRGFAHVPENRLTFGELTVEDNLDLGAWTARRAGRVELEERKRRVLDLFPALAERRMQVAGTMSGGEQQMLAVARSLMSDPKVLVLDEPSVGLAPQIVNVIFDVLTRLRGEGLAILLVEQNARAALKHSSRVYVLERGQIVAEGLPEDIEHSDALQAAYLGARVTSTEDDER